MPGLNDSVSVNAHSDHILRCFICWYVVAYLYLFKSSIKAMSIIRISLFHSTSLTKPLAVSIYKVLNFEDYLQNIFFLCLKMNIKNYDMKKNDGVTFAFNELATHVFSLSFCMKSFFTQLSSLVLRALVAGQITFNLQESWFDL